MSADNVIYVQEQKDGRWAVWEQSASNETKCEGAYGLKYFDDRTAAYDAGFQMTQDGYVEYGVNLLEKARTEKHVCPLCTGLQVIKVQTPEGRVRVAMDEVFYHPVSVTCPQCKGTGEIEHD